MKKTVLALGADIKNRFLLSRKGRFQFGPDIGDLSNAENYELFRKAVRSFTKRTKPDVVLCDVHPGYFSTRFAERLNAKRVQHHHAHVASVMREHGLRRPVIGVAFDGTGYGADGNMWGGEFLLVNKRGFERLAHLQYQKMPGGEKVVREPWRMVLSILGRKGFSFVKTSKKEDKEAILSMCAKDINSPLTSSAGRLFDAASALLGVAERASYEAEGPMKLEAMAKERVEDAYEFGISKCEGRYIVNTAPLFSGIIKDLKRKKGKNVISARFHNSMAEIIVKTAGALSKNLRIKDVALSGGVFQNRYLKEKAIKRLRRAKFKVFINEKAPVNDFNISLGQYHVFSGTGKN